MFHFYCPSQGIFNLKINKDGSLENETHIARVTPGDESCMQMKVPHAETKCALLANLYLSEGQKGKVSKLRKKILSPLCHTTTDRKIIHKRISFAFMAFIR